MWSKLSSLGFNFLFYHTENSEVVDPIGPRRSWWFTIEIRCFGYNFWLLNIILIIHKCKIRLL